MPLPFFFLYQIDVSFHNSPFVCIVFFSLGAKPVPRGFLCELNAVVCPRGAAFGHVDTPLRGISNDSAHICSPQYWGTAKPLP
jgi:hypothetical protein